MKMTTAMYLIATNTHHGFSSTNIRYFDGEAGTAEVHDAKMYKSLEDVNKAITSTALPFVAKADNWRVVRLVAELTMQ